MSILGRIIFYSMLVLIVVIAFIIILFLSFAFSDSMAAVVSDNTWPVANMGRDQLLSCYLRKQAATQVSVTWKREGLSGVVYKYENGAPSLRDQNSQFKGRTLLFPGALAAGNASLLIKNVKQSDAGRYACSISPGGAVNIHLRTAAYTAPTFTLTNSVLTAEAGRWFPRPQVTWLSLDDDVLEGQTNLSQSGHKVFRVTSRVAVDADDSYICRIENELVISVSTATVTGSSVSQDSYFTFNAAASPSFATTGVLCIWFLT